MFDGLLGEFRGRYRPLWWWLWMVLGISALTRLALWIYADVPWSPFGLLVVLVIGAFFDFIVGVYLGLPLLLALWFMPRRWIGARWGRWWIESISLFLLGLLLFVAMAEWTFWEEFQTRFNFIAVDYLVYTHEVIGNIRESYPVGLLLSGFALLTLTLFALTRRVRRLPLVAQDASFRNRSRFALLWLGSVLLATLGVRAEQREWTDNVYLNELAGNGIYQFFAAYRSASLDYARFYQQLPADEAWRRMRAELATPDATFFSDDPRDLRRRIDSPGTERHLNVVLISIESLSSIFSGTYGREDSLTPNLDALSKDSLVFTQLFASGTRTVRGLEALALSVPPTPGESIVKRGHNHGLFSLASVFNAKGYRSLFLYGGYGAFDNMNDFFGGNGYEVHDRSDIDADQVHHGNIWGVADEDLYSLSLQQFNAAHSEGKPFFAHIMTTSNHRPYTFPTGRGDWPQGKRESAVQYTDWAVSDFLRRAQSKAWFDDTIFVITADHCASSGGIAQLPAFRYEIPMWIYAPKHVAAGVVERRMAQIDIGPTVLGLLGFDYVSAFYGINLFALPEGRERALIGNYQRLGLLTQETLVELAPQSHVGAVAPVFDGDFAQPAKALDPELAARAIAYYQTASERFESGRMREDNEQIMSLPALHRTSVGGH
ncbi:MAG: LTA synthase family protein [Xanthomonadales bacterium]|nr:LTA synthase family protein [Xanthomonadales bacterium]